MKVLQKRPAIGIRKETAAEKKKKERKRKEQAERVTELQHHP